MRRIVVEKGKDCPWHSNATLECGHPAGRAMGGLLCGDNCLPQSCPLPGEAVTVFRRYAVPKQPKPKKKHVLLVEVSAKCPCGFIFKQEDLQYEDTVTCPKCELVSDLEISSGATRVQPEELESPQVKCAICGHMYTASREWPLPGRVRCPNCSGRGAG